VDEKVIEVDGLRFVLVDVVNAADRSFVHEQIKAFNDAISEQHRAVRTAGAQPLDIFVRDGKGRLRGGLIGSTYWGWLEVEDLWLDGSLRGLGYGQRLVGMAEAEARARDCFRVWLRTFSFQAKGFYEKMGYWVVGALEEYPPGETLFWMRKDLG
jgi:GNAT superfamily N-acetyltransferase